MANNDYFERACLDFDASYEKEHVLEIAFATRRVDKATPPDKLPAAIIAANVGLVCHITQTLLGGNSR